MPFQRPLQCPHIADYLYYLYPLSGPDVGPLFLLHDVEQIATFNSANIAGDTILGAFPGSDVRRRCL